MINGQPILYLNYLEEETHAHFVFFSIYFVREIETYEERERKRNRYNAKEEGKNPSNPKN